MENDSFTEFFLSGLIGNLLAIIERHQTLFIAPPIFSAAFTLAHRSAPITRQSLSVTKEMLCSQSR